MLKFDYSGGEYTLYSTVKVHQFKQLIDNLSLNNKYTPSNGVDYSKQQLYTLFSDNASYRKIEFNYVNGSFSVLPKYVDFVWNLLRLWDDRFFDIYEEFSNREINITLALNSKALEDLSNQMGYINEQVSEFRISELSKYEPYFIFQ